MSMLIEVNGSKFENFVSATVENRLDALTNSFVFEATSKDGKPLPIRNGNDCKILVNDQTVFTGSIEVVNVSYSSTDHSIVLKGRGKTADLLDSTLDAIPDIRPPLSLKALVEKVISQLNLDVTVTDNSNAVDFNEAEDLIGPDPGDNAWRFLEKYVRKRQVILSEDAEGNIVITQASTDKLDTVLLNRISDPSNTNNIMSGSVSYDQTKRYFLYKFSSSLNAIALVNAGGTDLSSLVNQSGGANDEAIRKTRQLILIPESMYSNDQCNLRAQWEANIRKTRGTVFAVTVDGFESSPGVLWEVNKLIHVLDEMSGIDEDMLVNSVAFSLNTTSGSTTTLSLVEKDSYTLSLQETNIGLGLT